MSLSLVPLVLALAGDASTTEPERLLLLPIKADRTEDAAFAKQLDQLVLVAAQSYAGFQVVSLDDINEAARIERARDVLGCNDDVACYAEIAGALGARRVITGVLGQIGDTYSLTLRLLDMQRTAVANAVNTEIARDKSDTRRAVRDAVGKLLAGPVRRSASTGPGQSATNAPGELSINSEPSGARVFIDAQPYGTTPVRVPSVPSGRRQLVLKLDGYAALTKDVLVLPGKSAEVSETLAVLRGGVVIRTKPEGASCTVDGQGAGTSPCELEALPIGEHDLELSLEHYAVRRERVAVVADKTLTRSFELDALPVHFTITSSPSGARAWLNDQAVGTTDLSLKLKPGRYRLKLAKPGYEDADKPLQVMVGTPNVVLFNLTPGLSETERARLKRQTTLRWSSTVLAAAAAGVWAWQGLRARSLDAKAKSMEPSDPSRAGVVESVNTSSKVADGALIATIVTGGAAALFWTIEF